MKQSQWSGLVGLHCDKFRAAVYGVFCSARSRSFVIIVKSMETFVLKYVVF